MRARGTAERIVALRLPAGCRRRYHRGALRPPLACCGQLHRQLPESGSGALPTANSPGAARQSGFELMQAARIKQWGTGLALWALSACAFAQSADPKRWQLNMGRGVTPTAQNRSEERRVGKEGGRRVSLAQYNTSRY